jgi:hypothetical protein
MALVSRQRCWDFFFYEEMSSGYDNCMHEQRVWVREYRVEVMFTSTGRLFRSGACC